MVTIFCDKAFGGLSIPAWCCCGKCWVFSVWVFSVFQNVSNVSAYKQINTGICKRSAVRGNVYAGLVASYLESLILSASAHVPTAASWGMHIMFSGFFRELKTQIVTLGQILRTREFWIYFCVIVFMLLVAIAGVRLLVGFDPLSRRQLGMAFSCKTGEGQLATIIIGSFVFAMACVFTLGEVVNWVEETRMARAPGRQQYTKIGYWRPILHVLGTAIFAATGYFLMLSWCS